MKPGAARPHWGGGEGRLAVSVATDVGRVRHNNEDYVAESRVRDATGEAFALWLVADGVGGGPRGEEASRTAVDVVAGYLGSGAWSEPASAISDAFGLASGRVHELTGTGASSTTMVAALVRESDATAWIANVGDSRAYLVSDGEARPVTQDHSLVAAEVAAGRLTPDEARTAPGRNVVTRTVGSRPDVVVDVFGPRRLGPGERLVLCTDGVHGMIDDSAIGRLASLALPEAATALIAAALDAGGRDNATALVGGFEAASQAAERGHMTNPAETSSRLNGSRLSLLAFGVAAALIVLTAILAAWHF